MCGRTRRGEKKIYEKQRTSTRKIDGLREGNRVSQITNSKIKNREESPGSKPIAVIFNDKDETENNTYNNKDSMTTKGNSMQFDSNLGKDGSSV